MGAHHTQISAICAPAQSLSLLIASVHCICVCLSVSVSIALTIYILIQCDTVLFCKHFVECGVHSCNFPVQFLCKIRLAAMAHLEF